MKLFKKLMSYFIALTMVLSLATLLGGNVHAAEDTTGNSLTITNNGKTAHTFELYQIFTGTKNTDDALGNIHWGSGVTEAGKKEYGDAATKAEKLKNPSDATEFAKALADGTKADGTKAESTYLQSPRTSDPVDVGKTCTFDNLATGYYLVKDTDNSQADSNGLKNSSYTEYICKVVGSTTANTKLDVPSVEKKVKDINDSTDTTTTGWQDSADYDIGDTVPYQITGTMPDNIDAYTTYKYIFTDTMGKGLTYTAKTATIKIDNEGDKDDKDVTSSFHEVVTNTTDGPTTVTWTCTNLKGIDGVKLNKDTKVVVTYSAKLNESAVIGPTGNPNEVNLTYSNNPNKGGDGETGKTPDDKNIVFTYKTVVNKVDQDKKSLAGAGFTLQKKVNGAYTDVKSFTAGKDTTFTFSGLDDGDYKLIESTTPAGYNTITPIEFTISATHEADSSDPKLTELTVSKTSDETKFTADKDAGSLTTDVVNKKGSELPSTGGMGTTLLYVAGGILVACAAAYVVLNKKRA